MLGLPLISRSQVEAARPQRQPVDARRPYGWLVEKEFSRRGLLENTAVVFLTNRECPLRCVMCDLWKHTLTEPTPRGAIPEQLDRVLPQLRVATQIKLYNSGNFFDAAAVPPHDYSGIASRMAGFHTVIVENHPRFCGPRCLEFKQMLPPETTLEIAIGLETVHEELLEWLGKEMTLDDYRRCVGWLRENHIFVRSFVLLGLPGLDERESVLWSLRSIHEAFHAGCDVCCVIAVRSGNGIMDQLAARGYFRLPHLASLEQTLSLALRQKGGRVFADLWQTEALAACPQCRARRLFNIQQMNHDQTPLPLTECRCTPAFLTALG